LVLCTIGTGGAGMSENKKKREKIREEVAGYGYTGYN